MYSAFALHAFKPNATNTHLQYVTFTASATAIMVARKRLNVKFIRGKNYEIKVVFLFPKYTNPTFTDAIIPYTSNHPTQHKYATVKFLYNRLNNYDLQKEEYQH
jgi:hypothetical protein